MSLVQQPEPFDDWDWIYEIKHDGFRALAVIEQGQCRFLSRRKHKLTGHQDLRALLKEVNAETAILDGELVVVDHLGRNVFAGMMQRRHPARFFAFDLLSLNGEDLTKLPLLARKEAREWLMGYCGAATAARKDPSSKTNVTMMITTASRMCRNTFLSIKLSFRVHHALERLYHRIGHAEPTVIMADHGMDAPIARIL